MKEDIKIIEKLEDGVIIEETNHYKANLDDINQQINNLEFEMRNLESQNKEIIRRYEKAKERKETLEKIREELDPNSGVMEIL